MKVDDIRIGDLVRVWGWGELLIVSDIYFDDPPGLWRIDAYGLKSHQMNCGLLIDQNEITVVSRAA
jgi:hypothetical protein